LTPRFHGLAPRTGSVWRAPHSRQGTFELASPGRRVPSGTRPDHARPGSR
jgi:hypothetical protein